LPRNEGITLFSWRVFVPITIDPQSTLPTFKAFLKFHGFLTTISMDMVRFSYVLILVLFCFNATIGTHWMNCGSIIKAEKVGSWMKMGLMGDS